MNKIYYVTEYMRDGRKYGSEFLAVSRKDAERKIIARNKNEYIVGTRPYSRR